MNYIYYVAPFFLSLNLTNIDNNVLKWNAMTPLEDGGFPHL
jgi:hypothetical protein